MSCHAITDAYWCVDSRGGGGSIGIRFHGADQVL